MAGSTSFSSIFSPGNRIRVNLNQGDGTFFPSVSYTAGGNPSGVATGDLNGDGKLDIVNSNGSQNDNDISIFIGNGDGTFQPQVRIPVGFRPGGVLLADFDQNNRSEVIVTHYGSNAIYYFKPDAAGMLGAPEIINIGGTQGNAVAADFDNDGWLDIMVGAGNAVLLRNNQGGGFLPLLVTPVPAGYIAAGDWDQDGLMDVVGTNGVLNLALVGWNHGGGTFTHLSSLQAGYETGRAGADDLNNDGLPEIVTCNGRARSISVFVNTTGATPTPTPAPTATPIPTASPTPTPAATPSPTPTPTATPPPTATPGGTPTPSPTTKAINLSTRMQVQTGDNVGIGGLIITGTTPKHVLVRAIGPSLTDFGVPNALADPVLELHGPGTFLTITNDNWRTTQEVEIQATGIPPTNDLESAIIVTLTPGAYTAIVRGNDGNPGVALVEAYDLNEEVDSAFANLSTRAFVGPSDKVVIAGFMLGGNGVGNRIVLRGIGTSLTALGDRIRWPTRNSNCAIRTERVSSRITIGKMTWFKPRK